MFEKNLSRSLLYLALLALLSACDAGEIIHSATGGAFDDDKFNTDNGFYVHIKADLEVIETGEPLNFDYVISCYNREVPGSFSGILMPKILFKATSTGAAISIVPPERYC